MNVCAFCGKGEREHMVSVTHREGDRYEGPHAESACAACRDVLNDGHTGDCVGCGADVADEQPYGLVWVGDGQAPECSLCRECYQRTGGFGNLPVFIAPGARRPERDAVAEIWKDVRDVSPGALADRLCDETTRVVKWEYPDQPARGQMLAIDLERGGEEATIELKLRRLLGDEGWTQFRAGYLAAFDERISHAEGWPGGYPKWIVEHAEGKAPPNASGQANAGDGDE